MDFSLYLLRFTYVEKVNKIGKYINYVLFIYIFCYCIAKNKMYFIFIYFL